MKKHLENNCLKMAFDLRKIKLEGHFLREMADFFEFPSYFGNNWSAMDDCMRDLSWFSEEKIEICFTNAQILEKNPKLQSEIQETLSFYQEFWENNDQKQVKIIIKQ
ncbi:MAG: barstar family protein [Bacteroidota bacterium]|nr:barstar family protein [Bacteroidota bacterium]